MKDLSGFIGPANCQSQDLTGGPALTGQGSNLPQLGDDLFGLVALASYRSIRPNGPRTDVMVWTTSTKPGSLARLLTCPLPDPSV